MRFHETVWCDGCGVEIAWTPQVKAGRHFCCAACFAGELCDCTARLEQEADRRAGGSAQPVAVVAEDWPPGAG